MQTATAGLPVRDFPRPGNIVRKTICLKSGKLPNAYCPPNHLISELFVAGTEPKDTCDVHVMAEICPDSGLLATPYCPNRISAVFIKGERGGDAQDQLPTESCNIHGPGSGENEVIVLKVCTDPRHNGTLYLANTPGLLETGGCPPEFVEEVEFKADEAPKLRCPLPDHQVQKIDLLNLNQRRNKTPPE